MPTYASNKSGGSFVPCPVGPQRLVCCDVVDHGWVLSSYAGRPKKQHKVTLRFQSEYLMPDGKPYLIGRRFTLSLKDNAALRPFLNAWRGRPLTEAECARFDLEVLIGVPAMASVIHEQKSRGLFAEIASIMPLPKGTARLLIVPSYVRVKDQTPAAADGAAPPDREDTPDDVPPF